MDERLANAMRAALVLVAACSSGTPKAAEDAKHPTKPAGDAGVVAVAVDAAPPKATVGDAQIRVVWPKVTAAMRAALGKTACGTAHTPFVAPSTTFGIGEVFVIVDGASVPDEAHVRLADCAFSPRVAVGKTFVVDSAVDHPVSVALRKRGDLAHVDALVAGTAVPIHLPIIGHAVESALEPGGLYEITTDDKVPESAWIVGGAAVVTDPNGVVLVKDLAPGAHAVTAWLPPRSGQPARRATGTITVDAGDLAELELTLE